MKRIILELRAKLENAASKSGRSLTQELEHRLERSFVRDELQQHIDGLLSDSLKGISDSLKGDSEERLREGFERAT